MSKPKIRIYGAMPIEMRRHFREAIEYFARELMSKQLAKNLNIQLRYKRELDSGALGQCDVLTDNTKPRHFRITICPKSDTRIGRQDIFKTLAHEMVHVKQFAQRELKFRVRSLEKMTWKGKQVNESKVAYEKLPWEKEAFGKEEILFIDYVFYSESEDYFFG